MDFFLIPIVILAWYNNGLYILLAFGLGVYFSTQSRKSAKAKKTLLVPTERPEELAKTYAVKKVDGVIGKRLDEIADRIITQFIVNWYNSLNKSRSRDFTDAVHASLLGVFVSFGSRLDAVQPAHLVSDLIETFVKHVSEYRVFEKTRLTLAEYSDRESCFNGLSNPDTRIQKLRQLSMKLIIHLLPKEDRQSPLVFSLLNEILATSVLLNAARLVSNPEFVNRQILRLLSPPIDSHSIITAPVSQKDVVEFFFKVLEARDLPTVPSCEYYCSIECGTQISKTRSTKSDTFPNWDDDLHLVLPKDDLVQDSFFDVNVFGVDPVKDVLLATCTIPFKDLSPNKLVQLEFPVKTTLDHPTILSIEIIYVNPELIQEMLTPSEPDETPVLLGDAFSLDKILQIPRGFSVFKSFVESRDSTLTDYFKLYTLIHGFDESDNTSDYVSVMARADYILTNFFSEEVYLEFGNLESTKTWVESLRTNLVKEGAETRFFDIVQTAVLEHLDQYSDSFKSSKEYQLLVSNLSNLSNEDLKSESTPSDEKRYTERIEDALDFLSSNLQAIDSEIEHADPARFGDLLERKVLFQTEQQHLRDLIKKNVGDYGLLAIHPISCLIIDIQYPVSFPEEYGGKAANKILGSIGDLVASTQISMLKGSPEKRFPVSLFLRVQIQELEQGWVILKSVRELEELNVNMQTEFPRVSELSFPEFYSVPVATRLGGKWKSKWVEAANDWLDRITLHPVFSLSEILWDFLKPTDLEPIKPKGLVSRAFKSAGTVLKKVASFDPLHRDLSPPSRPLSPSLTSLQKEDTPLMSVNPDAPPPLPSRTVSLKASPPSLIRKRQLSHDDLAELLQCLFDAIDELFHLAAPHLWVRQQTLNVAKIVLHKTFATHLSVLFQKTLDENTTKESIGKYLQLILDIWPDPAHPKPIDPSERTPLEVKNQAQVLLTSGHGSVIESSLESLARLLGRTTVTTGLTRVFTMLQDEELNEILFTSLLESLVNAISISS